MPKKVPITKLIPCDNRAIVLRLEPEKESKGGIILPDIGKDRPNKGIVLRVGPGRFSDELHDRVPMQIKRGDVVVFGKYDGTEQVENGEKIVILREQDIIAVLEPEADEE